MDNLQGGTLALEHRYDVLERAGRHGFVTLYHGRQDPFDKKVWVEAYDGLSDVGADIELFDRLKDAARLASSLDGPGMLRVVDYGELEGRVPFIISERSGGESLEAILSREGTLSAETTNVLIERLAQVLAVAHRREIAHGSIAPRWIYVDEEQFGAASVGHFQLAVSVAEILATESAVMSAEAVGAFPPEAFPGTDGEDGPSAGFSAAGDVWALGVLAYICLVGVHPFFEDGLDASEGILNLKNEDARPLAELGVDPQISDVVDRALEKDPASRWQSVEAFATAFERAVDPQAEMQSAAAADTPNNAEQAPAEPSTSPAADHRRSLDAPLQREPGPSDRLMTVVLVLLVLTNLAWLFYVTGMDASPEPNDPSVNKPEQTSVVTDEQG